MKIQKWLEEAEQRLADISSARLDVQLMVAHVLNVDRGWVVANYRDDLSNDVVTKLNELLDKRERRIPLAQILGTREFYGRNFIVNEHVLVPRPETEVLVENAIQLIPEGARVLELGTGSGCISVSLALARPDLQITATDISPDALKTAETNATNLEANLTFIQSDLFEVFHSNIPKNVRMNNDHEFDAILTNLPYVPVNARRQPEIEHEPDVALYGGNDGLDLYRTFFTELSDYLKAGGVCLVEYSPTQHKLVREYLRLHDFKSEPISEYIYRISSTDPT